jgi:hypothetical protein
VKQSATKLDDTLPSRSLSNEQEGKEKSMLEVILKRFEQPDEVRTQIRALARSSKSDHGAERGYEA